MIIILDSDSDEDCGGSAGTGAAGSSSSASSSTARARSASPFDADGEAHIAALANSSALCCPPFGCGWLVSQRGSMFELQMPWGVLHAHHSALRRLDGEVLLRYQRVPVTAADVARLGPNMFLNDSLIDFFLKWMEHEQLDEEQRRRAHIFNSYFFPQLVDTQAAAAASAARAAKAAAKALASQQAKDIKSAQLAKKEQEEQQEGEQEGQEEQQQQQQQQQGEEQRSPLPLQQERADASGAAAAREGLRRRAATKTPPLPPSLPAPPKPPAAAAPPATKGVHVDIFEKDFLFVPINNSLHWSLAVVCNPSCTPSDDDGAGEGEAESSQRLQPCIILMDSLKAHHSQTATKALRKFLQSEWDLKKAAQHGSRSFSAATVKGFSVTVPTQSNLCDCGVFVLHFIDEFVKDLPKVNARFIESKGAGTMGKEWFDDVAIANKRIAVLELIREKCANG